MMREKKKIESLIKHKKVPFVLTHKYLKEYKSSDFEIPFGIYYQLQFIFNYFDMNPLAHNLINAIQKLNNVRVPSFENIVPKSIAFFLKKDLLTSLNKLKKIHVPQYKTLVYYVKRKRMQSYNILCYIIESLTKLKNVHVPEIKIITYRIKKRFFASNKIACYLIDAKQKIINVHVPRFRRFKFNPKSFRDKKIQMERKNFGHIIEIFLIAIRKFNNIQVPKTDKLIKSVRAKNIALILQKRRQNKQAKKKKTEKQIEQHDEDYYSIKYENELQEYSKEMPKMPKTFDERVNKNEYEIYKQEKKKNAKSTKGIKF